MNDGPPFATAQYIEAFKSYEAKISAEQMAMLKAHAKVAARTLSTAQLARVAGFGKRQFTYAAYGRLGHALAKILDPGTRRLASSDRIWTRYLGKDSRDPNTKELLWTMYPAVAKALDHLGWVPRKHVKMDRKLAEVSEESFLFVTRAGHNPGRVREKASHEWSCGKEVRAGSSIFVYVAGEGICHEWVAVTAAKPDRKWGNACGVRLVADIKPPVSIQVLRDSISRKMWAPPHLNFRGYSCVAVPSAAVATIRRLCAIPANGHPKSLSEVERQSERELRKAQRRSVEERRKRLRYAARYPTKIVVTTDVFIRNEDVVAEVQRRARGRCERCGKRAPFLRASDGSPYLEVHHRVRLADGGEDTLTNAVALCPNCHRYSHFG